MRMMHFTLCVVCINDRFNFFHPPSNNNCPNGLKTWPKVVLAFNFVSHSRAPRFAQRWTPPQHYALATSTETRQATGTSCYCVVIFVSELKIQIVSYVVSYVYSSAGNYPTSFGFRLLHNICGGRVSQCMNDLLVSRLVVTFVVFVELIHSDFHREASCCPWTSGWCLCWKYALTKPTWPKLGYYLLGGDGWLFFIYVLTQPLSFSFQKILQFTYIYTQALSTVCGRPRLCSLTCASCFIRACMPTEARMCF